jgi:hypothetical protein
MLSLLMISPVGIFAAVHASPASTCAAQTLASRIVSAQAPFSKQSGMALAQSSSAFSNAVQGYRVFPYGVGSIWDSNPETCTVSWNSFSVNYILEAENGSYYVLTMGVDPAAKSVFGVTTSPLALHSLPLNGTSESYSGYAVAANSGYSSEVNYTQGGWWNPKISAPSGNCGNGVGSPPECNLSEWTGLQNSTYDGVCNSSCTYPQGEVIQTGSQGSCVGTCSGSSAPDYSGWSEYLNGDNTESQPIQGLYSTSREVPAAGVCFANGIDWVFYADGSGWGYKTSVNNGTTWSLETTETAITAPQPTAGSPDMVFVCSGTTVYVAAGNDNSACTSRAAHYDSGTLNSNNTVTWGTEQSFNMNYYLGYLPHLVIDSAGNPVMDMMTTNCSGNEYVEVWRDVSGTWSNLLTQAEGGCDNTNNLIALPSSEELMLWYPNTYSPSCGLTETAVTTYDGSSTWSTPVVTSPRTSLYSYNGIDIDASTSGAVCLYEGSGTTGTYYATFTYGGSSISTTALDTSTDTGAGAWCNLATDGADNIVIDWLDTSAVGTTYYLEQSVSTNAGSTFSSAIAEASFGPYTSPGVGMYGSTSIPSGMHPQLTLFNFPSSPPGTVYYYPAAGTGGAVQQSAGGACTSASFPVSALDEMYGEVGSQEAINFTTGNTFYTLLYDYNTSDWCEFSYLNGSTACVNLVLEESQACKIAGKEYFADYFVETPQDDNNNNLPYMLPVFKLPNTFDTLFFGMFMINYTTGTYSYFNDGYYMYSYMKNCASGGSPCAQNTYVAKMYNISGQGNFNETWDSSEYTG